MKRSSLAVLCLAGAVACQAEKLVNLASNPKDLSDAALQSDTIGAGANWDAAVNGWPHATASSRLDQPHAESNLTRETATPWLSARGDKSWLGLYFASPVEARRLELSPAPESETPDTVALTVSDDGFQKDIREAARLERRQWQAVGPGKPLLVDFPSPVSAKEFKLSFSLAKPGVIGLARLRLLGVPGKAGAAATGKAAKHRYDNPANLAFNPNDALDPEWKAESNGYPHVSAQSYGQGACQQGYPYFVNDGHYNRRFWCQNWDKWWPNWLKVDFGKPTDFQYVKFFSTAAWNDRGRIYVPKEIVIEASDDNFAKDVRKELRINGDDVLKSWNSQRLDEAKFISLPKPVRARYVRFNFPGDQRPHRLLVEELEIYKDVPPGKKIERVDLDKPALGSEVDAQILARTPGAVFWLENSIRKVFKEDIPIPRRTDNAIRLSAAQNESESFQLVIQPKEVLHNVSLCFSDLVGANGEKISASRLEHAFVGYVFVHTPSHVKWRSQESSEGRRGDWPDPLLEEKTLGLTEKRNYPVWVTVNVPPDAMPGEYAGTIGVVTGGKTLHVVDLQLAVRAFAIPNREDRHMFFTGYAPIRLGMDIVKGKYGNRFSEAEIAQAGLQAMADNGFNTLFSEAFPAYAHPKVTIKAGKLTLDTEEFDRWTEYLLSLGFRRIRLPLSSDYNCMGSRTGAGWHGFAYMSPDYEKYFLGPDGYLAQLAKRLEGKGWLKSFDLEIWHEPQCAQSFDGWKEAGKLAKRVRGIAPALPLSMGGCYPGDQKELPEVLRNLDYCSVYLSGMPPERLQELRRTCPDLKIETWFNGGYLIDFPGTNCRILPWLTWRNDMDGYGHYQTVSNIDPWENTMTFNCFTPSTCTRCGDEMLLYPMRDPNAKKPYWNSSIRLRMEHEGADDFEYLWLLRDRIQKLERQGGHKPELSAAKAALTKAEGIVERPWRDGQFAFLFTDNPKAILDARELVAGQIEALGGILEKGGGK